MGQTIAQALREEGERKGSLKTKRQTLQLQLFHEFGQQATADLVATINKTTDLRTLDKWLINIIDAETPEDIGIVPGIRLAGRRSVQHG
jgi:hypothetical protein